MDRTVQGLNLQAINFAEKGELSDAVACLNAALSIDSRNYHLWYNLGIIYRDFGYPELAYKALVAAYEIDPEDEAVLESLSLFCFDDDKLEGAYRYAYEAINSGRANFRIWNNLGVYLFSEEKYAAAAEAFENALGLYPCYYDALINLRDTYEKLCNSCGMEECIRKLKEYGFQ